GRRQRRAVPRPGQGGRGDAGPGLRRSAASACPAGANRHRRPAIPAFDGLHKADSYGHGRGEEPVRCCVRTKNALPLLPVLLASSVVLAGDALPSWNEGPAKKAIVDFVTRVTTEGGADVVPAPERIAVFDNDGTLWC